METHVGEVLLRHGEDVGGVGQVDVAALVIGGHVLGFAAHEAVERSLVVALDPAGFVEGERIPTTLRTVLVQQAVLDDLELQLPDGADDLAAVETVGEELRHALVHQLIDAFVQLLGAHRVGVFDVLE